MMRIASALLVAALIAAPAAQAQSVESAPMQGPRAPFHRANSSAVIAAEIAFNQLAQQKGQWTAFLETSSPEAEMFTPQRVNAHIWLKNRANPPKSVTWQAHEVWSSCDGTYALTRGGSQRPDGTFGYFTTLWQRQPKKGDYKWLIDQGSATAAQIAAPDMITGLVADCRAPAPKAAVAGPGPAAPPKKRKPSDIVPSPGLNTAIPGTQPIAIALEGDRKDGRSRDGTLDWSSAVAPDGARTFVVRIWKNDEMREVLRSVVNAESAGG
jgi:hypothetical protein